MAINGAFLGGVAEGMNRYDLRAIEREKLAEQTRAQNQDVSLRQRAIKLQETQVSNEEGRAKLGRADKIASDLMQTINETIVGLRNSGASPTDIEAAVMPLAKGVTDAYAISGRDPKTVQSQIKAMVGIPAAPNTTLGKLRADFNSGYMSEDAYNAAVAKETAAEGSQRRTYTAQSDIGKLAQDRAAGLITTTEFDEEKARLLSKGGKDYKASTDIGKLEQDYAAGLVDETTYQAEKAKLGKDKPHAMKAALSDKIGEEVAKKFVARREKALKAVSAMSNSSEALKLIESEMFSGFGADYMLQLGKALNQVGFSYNSDAIRNTEEFAARMARDTSELISMFGAGTGISNVDLAFTRQMVGGEITLNRESMKKIVQLNRVMSRQALAAYNAEAAEMESQTVLPFDMRIPEPAIDIDVTADPAGIRKRRAPTTGQSTGVPTGQ